jgi:hypothetical protein
MKYLAAAASGLLATLASLVLLNIASAMCFASGAATLPAWVRFTIFGIICAIALGIGFTIYRAALHRLSENRTYPGQGPSPDRAFPVVQKRSSPEEQ